MRGDAAFFFSCCENKMQKKNKLCVFVGRTMYKCVSMELINSWFKCDSRCNSYKQLKKKVFRKEFYSHFELFFIAVLYI